MTARVLLGDIVITEVSYAAPEVQVSALDAYADVSYPDVYAAASYVDVQLAAEVTMPDIISVEVVELSDLATILFEKAQADTVASSDQITTVGFDKALADLLTAPDAFSFAQAKTFVDSQPVEDLYASLFAKAPINETLAPPTDEVVLQPQKGLAEALAPWEFMIRAVDKALTDSVESTDIQTTEFSKALDETQSTDDTTQYALEKPLEDASEPVDAITAFDVGMALFDESVLIDNMDGDIEYFIVKLIGELLSVSDENVVDFQGNKSDNVATSDGGSLLAQSYCDITYFAEDYVGESRTF